MTHTKHAHRSSLRVVADPVSSLGGTAVSGSRTHPHIVHLTAPSGIASPQREQRSGSRSLIDLSRKNRILSFHIDLYYRRDRRSAPPHHGHLGASQAGRTDPPVGVPAVGYGPLGGPRNGGQHPSGVSTGAQTRTAHATSPGTVPAGRTPRSVDGVRVLSANWYRPGRGRGGTQGGESSRECGAAADLGPSRCRAAV